MAVVGSSMVSAKSVTQTGNQVSKERTELGKSDFLQLLVTKLRYNDPMAAGKEGDTDFIAQMAQFSSLEQMQNLNTTMAQMAKYQTLIQASSLVGREVEAQQAGTSEIIKGKVESVMFGDDGPILMVGGIDIYMSEIIRLT